MTKKVKLNAKTKELKLLEKIEQAKKELTLLQEKRKKEIGALAYKHGLENFDNHILDKVFSEIAQKLQS